MKVPSKDVTLKNGKVVSLRSATPVDASLFLEHLVIAHSESYRNLNTDGESWKKMPLAEEEKILSSFESASNKLMLIALHDNKIIGGIGLFGQEREFTKHSAGLGISIQNAWSGLGLGSIMIDYALENAKKRGIHRIDLTVRTYNSGAIALYEKKGFRQVGLLKDAALIDGKYADEYYYELILN